MQTNVHPRVSLLQLDPGFVSVSVSAFKKKKNLKLLSELQFSWILRIIS